MLPTFKAIAEYMTIPVICTMPLSRGYVPEEGYNHDEYGERLLNVLRMKEYDRQVIDGFIFLFNPDINNKELVDIRVVKNPNNKTGLVHMRLNQKTGVFTEI